MREDPTPRRRLWNRRTFLGRMSGAAVAAFAALTGAPRTAAFARAMGSGGRGHAPRRPRDVITCTPVDCEGCACGGDFFHCIGCGQDYRKCYPGYDCQVFELPCP
jgi:hypothetical protein